MFISNQKPFWQIMEKKFKENLNFSTDFKREIDTKLFLTEKNFSEFTSLIKNNEKI